MPPAKESTRFAKKLVNNLSVEDAQRLLRSEGGALSLRQIVVRFASIAAVAATTARAISLGDATIWHLTLPMAAQYLAWTFLLGATYLVVRHPDLRKDGLQCVRLWVGLAAAALVAVGIRSWRVSSLSWFEHASADAKTICYWIVDAEMHWPMLLAFLGIVQLLYSRVQSLLAHGPPFTGVSLGCAMRAIVLLFGVFLLPVALEGAVRPVWTLWGLMLGSELLALGAHWDIQRRLRKIGALEASPQA